MVFALESHVIYIYTYRYVHCGSTQLVKKGTGKYLINSFFFLVVFKLGCTSESPGQFLKMLMPESQPSRFHLIGVGNGLTKNPQEVLMHSKD